jgi:PEP-CTERM motif
MQILITLISLIVFLAFTPLARADAVTGSAGCVPVLPATACKSPSGGTATVSISSGQYSTSGVLVTLTSISGLTTTNPEVIEDLNPSAAEQWSFVFDTAAHTFSISDVADSDFLLNGTISSFTPGTNSVVLNLTPTLVTFVSGEDGGLTFSKSLIGSGDSGTATVNYDPDDITGVTATAGFHTPKLPTVPEPGTLVLFASGLLGLALFIGQRGLPGQAKTKLQ